MELLPWCIVISPWLALSALIVWDASNKKPFINKDGLLDINAILTAVLALFTAVSCLIALLQWRVLEKTDDTYWAAQRPWVGLVGNVKIDALKLINPMLGLVSPIFRSSAEFSVNLQNFGNIPASETGIATYLSAYSSYQSDMSRNPSLMYLTLPGVREKMKHGLCASAEKKFDREALLGSTAFYAPTLFPKESTSVKLYVDFPSEKAEKSDDDISRVKEYVGKVELFSVAICVVYKFGYNNERRGSTFFFVRLTPKGKPYFDMDDSNYLKSVDPGSAEATIENNYTEAE